MGGILVAWCASTFGYHLGGLVFALIAVAIYGGAFFGMALAILCLPEKWQDWLLGEKQ